MFSACANVRRRRAAAKLFLRENVVSAYKPTSDNWLKCVHRRPCLCSGRALSTHRHLPLTGDGRRRPPAANGRRYTPTDGPEVLRTVGAITQQVAQTGSVRNEHTQAEAEEAARARAGEHQSTSHCSSSSAEVAAAAVRLVAPHTAAPVSYLLTPRRCALHCAAVQHAAQRWSVATAASGRRFRLHMSTSRSAARARRRTVCDASASGDLRFELPCRRFGCRSTSMARPRVCCR